MGELHWNAEALRQQLDALWPGLQIEVVDETGSTNTDLLQRTGAIAPRGSPAASAASSTDAEPADADVQVRRSVESRAYRRADTGAPFMACLRVAERQTGGRGRQGRHWQSERGATLTFSLALPLAAKDASGLSLALGVALAETLDPLRPGVAPRVALKWPNDLWLLDGPGLGRKLGGLLIETAPRGTQRIAVIGFGLNVHPLAALGALSSGFACARELDPTATAPVLLARVAAPLIVALQAFERGGFAPFRPRYATRDLLCGQRVVTTQPGVAEGTAEGIDTRGALLVRTADGATAAVSSGEVSVRFAAASLGAEAPAIQQAT